MVELLVWPGREVAMRAAVLLGQSQSPMSSIEVNV